MSLLQRLLADRSECMLLYKNKIYCCCGDIFDECVSAENHLVKHERVEFPSTMSKHQERDILETLQKLSEKIRLKNEERLLPKVYVPLKTYFVLLEEGDITAGFIKDVACSECSQVVDNFAALCYHFARYHPDRWGPETGDDFILLSKCEAMKRIQGWSYCYFCPIPGCKYHVLQIPDCSNTSKNFPSLKLLKQHYTKVHVTREFECEKCSEKFATLAILNRHLKVCGVEFSCSTCDVKYRSFEILQTHCRRKGHFIRQSKETSRKKKNFRPRSSGKIQADTHFRAITDLEPSDILHVAPWASSRLPVTRPLLIAPRPSQLHLSAAIALSELAADKKFFSKVDVGNQTDCAKGIIRSSTTIMTQTPSTSALNGRKRTAETQTKSSRARRSKKAKLSKIVPFNMTIKDEPETQNPKDASSESVGRLSNFPPFPSLISVDRPLWAASGTQTSPTNSGDIFKDLLLSCSIKPPAPTTPVSVPLFRPPRLGEIEPFNSTETQTDGFEVSSRDNEEEETWREEDELALTSYMEAETQFDLDDILCSNYTQTGFPNDLISSPLLSIEQEVTNMNSIETQTMYSIFDLGSASNSVDNYGMREFETSHMETQTGEDFNLL